MAVSDVGFRMCVLVFPFRDSSYDCGQRFLDTLVTLIRPSCRTLSVVGGHLGDLEWANVRVVSVWSPRVSRCGDSLPAKALRLVLGQLRLTWEVVRCWRSTDVFATYLSDGLVALPMLVARMLRRRLLIVYTGSAAESLATRASLLSRVASAVAAALSEVEYSLADAIAVLSLSEAEQGRLRKHRAKMQRLTGPDSRFVTGNSYTDFEAFSLGPPPLQRPALVAFVGRLAPEKGAREFGLGVALLAKEIADLEVVVCGDGPLRAELAAMLHDALPEQHVDIRGTVPHAEVSRVLRTARFLVVPSHTEVLATVAVEAMACGAVCCATPVGATGDIVIDGVTGFIVPGPVPLDIRDTVLRAWEHPDLDGIQVCARQFAVDHFSFEAVQHRWRRVLQRMMEAA